MEFDSGGETSETAAPDVGADSGSHPHDANERPLVDAEPDEAGLAEVAAAETSATTKVNGCGTAEFAMFDRTAGGAERQITIFRIDYTPKCMKIKAGQEVLWKVPFFSHPMAPGVAPSAASMSAPDSPGNPIKEENSSSEYAVSFQSPGTFAYYCSIHESSGMYGAIEVVR